MQSSDYKNLWTEHLITEVKKFAGVNYAQIMATLFVDYRAWV
jgi:hypothetical protein